MDLRKRHVKVLERKLTDMELRTKAQETMMLVRKTLKKCIREKKSPTELENGIPSEVTTVKMATPTPHADFDMKKLVADAVSKEVNRTMKKTIVQRVDDCIDRNPKLKGKSSKKKSSKKKSKNGSKKKSSRRKSGKFHPKSPWDDGSSPSSSSSSSDDDDSSSESDDSKAPKNPKKWFSDLQRKGLFTTPLDEREDDEDDFSSDGFGDRNQKGSRPVFYKRHPLPKEVVWNGKSGNHFEKFVRDVEGHTHQQQFMGYLLQPWTINAWFKHGKNPKKLVRLGLKHDIHNAFKVISPMQLLIDVEWLYGALKGALSFQSKTASLLMKSHAHKDGIKLWWELLNTHRFNGNINVHLDQQQAMLS